MIFRFYEGNVYIKKLLRWSDETRINFKINLSYGWQKNHNTYQELLFNGVK